LPGLAVIVCTWNRAESLAHSLASLEAVQPPAARVEVIVVDNNSRDATQAWLAERAPAWTLGNLHTVFEAQQGKQFALNAGVARAQALGCSLAAFTDDDIEFPADWLHQVLRSLHSGVDLVGGRTELRWPDGHSPAWFDPSMSAIVGGVELGPVRLEPVPADYAPAGANLLARLAVFDRLGGFNPTYFRHMDFEFGQRVLLAGLRVAYDPSVVVVAPVEPAMLSQRYFRRWSFKAGIAPWQDHTGLRCAAWVPLWVWRRLFGDALGWLVAPLRGESPAQRFARELRTIRASGLVASAWISRWRSPQAYLAWVEKRSQKRQNVY
jgi:glycosyltransferase involved in cell wall biosynthesis